MVTVKKRGEMGKWGLWNFFASEKELRPYLPHTALFSKPTLQLFLSKYNSIFIKPDYGWGGNGIIKAWKKNNGYWFVHVKGKAVYCPSLDALFLRIKQMCRKNARYIIQQGIRLANINGRPFDIRLMMMRKQGKWTYMGMLAKVAGQTSVITNVQRGNGYVTDIDYALKNSLGLKQERIFALKQEMKRLGYKTCVRFDKYLKYWQIGLDLAVDVNGKLWMIEENTGPAASLFAKLKNKTMYQEIIKIQIARRNRMNQRKMEKLQKTV